MNDPRTTPPYASDRETPPVSKGSEHLLINTLYIMAKKQFTFDGHVSERTYAPSIDNEAFDQLPENSILEGSIDHVIAGENPRAQVLINGHRLQITLWEHTADEARAYIGKSVEVAYTGTNIKGYPKLSLLLK